MTGLILTGLFPSGVGRSWVLCTVRVVGMGRFGDEAPRPVPLSLLERLQSLGNVVVVPFVFVKFFFFCLQELLVHSPVILLCGPLRNSVVDSEKPANP